MNAYTLPLPRRARRAWDRVAFAWYWFRVFFALGLIGFAVGLILVAQPIR